MAVYIRQTFVQAMGDASFCLETYLHTYTHTYTQKWANFLICACFQTLCVLCVCLNHSMDLDNRADNEF